MTTARSGSMPALVVLDEAPGRHKHNVGWFDVSQVDDSQIVGAIERCGDLPGKDEGFFAWEAAQRSV